MMTSLAILVLLTVYTALMTSAMVVSYKSSGRYDTIQAAVGAGV